MPITTLLFDLDDTLLGNDMDRFVPPYFKSFATHVAGHVNPQMFVKNLQAGVAAMIANDDPRRTLEQVFGAAFYPGLDVTPETFMPLAESYYVEKYPALKAETQTVVAAREVIQWALAHDYKVVIATNALFPRSAILQRLDWAGVSADEFPYSLITTLEFMHFAKPHPEYFAEILALVDSRPEECLMVGNDWEQDIAPAAALGLHTFWVSATGTPTQNHAHPVGIGALADFLKWVSQPGNLAYLEPLPVSSTSVWAQQAASVSAMLGVAQTASPEDWLRRPAPAEWSLTEIACHLRDTEIEINLPRLQTILNDSNPFISAIESDPWALTRDYQTQSGPEALAAFAEARRTKLALLDSLTPADWLRPARHAIFGPTTLQELVAFTAEHDRLHLRQMKENLAAEL